MGINATNPLGQPFWHNRMFDVWNKLFKFCAVAVHTITDIFNQQNQTGGLLSTLRSDW